MAQTATIEAGRPHVLREACDHAELAYLGHGGNASYYRCRACGAAVIEQRGRTWTLRISA